MMQYKKEHEPELTDIDDYEKPLPKKKLRLIILSFTALAAVWIIIKVLLTFFVK